jgi:hypothetical protein
MNLREWRYVNPPAGNSSSYKKRFEKLIKYHIDHASSELESITKKDIKDDSFRLSEHYNNGHHEFDRDIIVSYDKDSDTFMLRIFVDGKEVDDILRKGYEDFVDAAEDYMFLPDYNTPEYDDLLTESLLNEWKYMNNSPKASQPASSKTNKEKFKELTDYMANHIGSLTIRAEIVRVDDNGFTYKEYYKSAVGKQDYVTTLLVGYSRFNSSWRYELYLDTNLIKEVQGSGWEELLEALEKYFHVPKIGSPEYKSLTESISIADEFKLYENLF